MNNKIIYLLRNSELDLKLFNKSIELLKTNFLPTNNYPIIIFHEDIPMQIFDDIQNNHSIKFNIEKINFEIPKFIEESKVPREVMTKSIGYRHMCRFYAGQMYFENALKDTDYYLRLDNDSFFTEPVKYDIFKYMEDNNYIYGYNAILEDNPQVTVGLFEACQLYSQTRKTLKDMKDIPFPKVYYTNFEIAKFKWFLNPEYLDFYNFIDMLGGIYQYRWGDHIIKFLGLSMLLEDKYKNHFTDLPYVHGNFFNYK